MQGILSGTTIGVIKGDARSLDYSSYVPVVYGLGGVNVEPNIMGTIRERARIFGKPNPYMNPVTILFSMFFSI